MNISAIIKLSAVIDVYSNISKNSQMYQLYWYYNKNQEMEANIWADWLLIVLWPFPKYHLLCIRMINDVRLR